MRVLASRIGPELQLVDARNLSDSSELDAELCIVGAGPAGISSALEFVGSGARVCLLESGGEGPGGAEQALNAAENAGHAYMPLAASRLRGFGGTSNHWEGWCRPLDVEDFESRAWIPESGWPITRAQLEPFFGRARELCEIGEPLFEAEQWPESERARAFPFAEERFVSAAAQLSPPTRFGAAYRGELEAATNIRIVTHATATELIESRDGTRIDQLVARTLEGQRLVVRAREFVVAAGGIENPRLLLASRGRSAAGIGNGRDLVGRYFLEHPHVDSARFMPSDPDRDIGLYRQHSVGSGRIQGIFVLSRALREREKLAGFSASFEPAFVESSRGYESLRVLIRAARNGHLPDHWDEHVGRVIGDIDGTADALLRRARGIQADPRVQRVALRTEQVPNRDSRVTLAATKDALDMPKARLIWRLGEQDERTLRRGRELLAAELGRAGLGRMQVAETESDRLSDYALGGHHHMGTTRMASDPARGVVDSDCRVHGVSNLHMAGSSVFTTAGFANPTLNLVALAVRLGRHLRRRLE